MCFPFTIQAQDLNLYQKQIFIAAGDTMPYRLLLPENYEADKKYPLVLFLHGSGERGRDNELQLVHGGKLFLDAENRQKYPSIVVFPQCAADSYWSNVNIALQDSNRIFKFFKKGPKTKSMAMLLKLVDNLKNNYSIEPKQVYAAGLSMGGMGTFELVRRNPKFFAAAISICGGANTGTAKKISKTHWWLFHGAKDNVVPPDLSRNMAKALSLAGADVKLTIYPLDNHNSWDSAFAEPGLLSWLFAQHR